MKVLYLTNLLSPYKVAFFNELAKYCDLDVLYDGVDKDKREDAWYKDNKVKFNIHKLGSFDFKKLKEHLESNYDIIVNGKYASKYGAYLSTYLTRHKKQFFIAADGGLIDKRDNFLKKSIRTSFMSKATYYLSSGEETSKYLIHYGANKDNIFTYNFTSLYKKDILTKPIEYKDKSILRKEKDLDYKRIFISVGSLIERKGYDLLLKAIPKELSNDTLFLIIGSGDKKEELEHYIKANNLNNVKLLGFMDKDSIFDYLKLSDVFVLPSREDIWGLVINESMANGLPIISSDNVVAAKELIDSKYLYNPKDVYSLNKLLMEFNNYNEKELYEIGKTNSDRIKGYTIENMAKRHIEIFNEVLNNEK